MFAVPDSNRLWMTLTVSALLYCGHISVAQTPLPTRVTPPADATPSAVPLSSGTLIEGASSARINPGLVIGGGDLLEISVFGAPDYVKQVRVSDSDEITLPLMGVVKVGGLTITDAERLLAKRLSDGGFFNNPQVNVVEKEYATQGIAVLGEVQKPGIYPLLGQHTLFEAISVAGGTTQKAGRTAVISHRNRQQPPETVVLSYDANNMSHADVPVLPGDTLVISKAGVVYVVGDVHTPTGVIMENSHLTVLQAIAMAQGTNPTAALDRAKVIRKIGAGQEEIPLSLKKILAAKAPDVALHPDDILFVPSSAAKSAGRRGLEAVVEAATGVAMYRRY